jgi:MGT family glycosyltransferase
VSRFLFVVPQFSGHVNPAVSVAIELALRGHDVAWVAPERTRPLLPEGAAVFPVDDDLVERLRATYAEHAGQGLGMANDFRCFWEDLVLPLARGTLQAVEQAIEAYRPDMLVADQYALAGGLAARRHGLLWSTLVPTLFVRVDAALERLPRAKAWLDERLFELQAEAGLEPVDKPDRSPDLVVAFSLPSLAGAAGRHPSSYRFVGATFEHRHEIGDPGSFPWSELGDRPRVLVSVGTWAAYRRRRFFAAVFEAFAKLPARAIVVAPPELVPEPPENVLVVRQYVNLLALYPHVDAVLCHAGQGIVFETLAHGLPLVVAPVSYDHPLIAQEVVEAGAGIRIRAVRTSAGEVREAVEKVLADPGYRAAAERIRDALRLAGGAPAAADALEALLDEHRRSAVA